MPQRLAVRRRGADYVGEHRTERLADRAVEAMRGDHGGAGNPLQAALGRQPEDDVDHVLIAHPLRPGVAFDIRPDEEHFGTIDDVVLHCLIHHLLLLRADSPCQPRWLRKSRVRATFAASKIWRGGPSSITRPRSNTITLSATRRAKSISWVTTSMVIPSSASAFMTLRTSPIVSGSSADVGSSKSISAGPLAHAPALAHPR